MVYVNGYWDADLGCRCRCTDNCLDLTCTCGLANSYVEPVEVFLVCGCLTCTSNRLSDYDTCQWR